MAWLEVKSSSLCGDMAFVVLSSRSLKHLARPFGASGHVRASRCTMPTYTARLAVKKLPASQSLLSRMARPVARPKTPGSLTSSGHLARQMHRNHHHMGKTRLGFVLSCRRPERCCRITRSPSASDSQLSHLDGPRFMRAGYVHRPRRRHSSICLILIHDGSTSSQPSQMSPP